MSKVQLAGNANGTGIFTIASPNSNTDRTLTLPDNTGTLLTSASSIPASQLGSQFSINSGAPSNSFVMNASGVVTRPFQPAFRARLTSQPSFTGPAAAVIGGTWTTSVNVGSYYNAATSRFTAPVAGAYQFNAVVATVGGIGYFNYLSAELWVNGARVLSGGWDGGGQSYGQTSNSGVLYLQAGDYVQLACEASKTFTVESGDATSFSGFLIG
jgi:hypothetical protein